MEKLYLIYINYVGKDWKGKYVYEFIFSDSIQNIDGENWDTYPASGMPNPPYEEFIKVVGRLESDLKLDVVQESDTFAVWDAVDGVIALAWENINGYEEYPNVRLCFKFGEINNSVTDKLYEKDLTLAYNYVKNEKHKKTTE
jgi:hypothetical protein